jgi:hypothetical protein
MEKDQTGVEVQNEYYRCVETYLVNRGGFGHYLREFHNRIGSAQIKRSDLFKQFDYGNLQLKKLIEVITAVVNFYENKPLYNPYTGLEVDQTLDRFLDNDPYSLTLHFARMDFDILTRMSNAREEDTKRIEKMRSSNVR